jgi:hypothetical protein
MDDYNADWNVLYPFSAVCILHSRALTSLTRFGHLKFLSPYKIELPIDPSYTSHWFTEGHFSLSAVNDVVNTAEGTRSLTLKIHHPGMIWTGELHIAFILGCPQLLRQLLHSMPMF